ncbi:MAG: hypothetical protein AB7Q29_16605 [Vicinamibacterales bacterium]
MHVTMVKKRLADGSECRKCADATAQLRLRGLWERVDDVVWADERDPASAGMTLAERHAVDQAPFFIVNDADGEAVYTSVLQLMRERLDVKVTAAQRAQAIDADDLGI